MVGVFFGCLIGGYLCDKFGRGFTGKLAMTFMGPVVILMGFSTDYLTYAGLHVVSLIFNAILWVSTVTHVVELAAPKAIKLQLKI